MRRKTVRIASLPDLVIGRDNRGFLALLGLTLALAWAFPARAQNLVDTQWHLRPLSQAAAEDGLGPVKITGMPLPPAKDYDIPLAAPLATVAKIKAALVLVAKHSPEAARGIARLAQHGTPRVVYDAMFPKRELSRIVIAAFLVGEWTPQDGKRDFTVIVGRFGANWSVEELAAVLVHELVGHGTQRLEDRFGRDRPIDLECQARLWQQMYYIDAGMPQDTFDMVSFRKTTDRRVCNDFRLYVARVEPATMAAWDHGRPDMPHILAMFHDYYLRTRKAPPK